MPFVITFTTLMGPMETSDYSPPLTNKERDGGTTKTTFAPPSLSLNSFALYLVAI